MTSPPQSTDRPPFVCQVCQRQYERYDHLSRHLDSHRNERKFRCSECPRAFNRRDLLLRHQANHSKSETLGARSPGYLNRRAVKACDACVTSKLKCDNGRPCQRCSKRRISCHTESLDRAEKPPCDSALVSELWNQTGQTENYPTQTSLGTVQNDDSSESFLPSQVAASTSKADLLWTPAANEIGIDADVPSFFGHIMAPGGSDLAPLDAFQLPPDISSVLPDQDWLGDLDIFGADFIPAVDNAFAAPPIDNLPQQDQTHPLGITEEDFEGHSSRRLNQADHARERHAIFKRSPWLWIPERNSNAFTEHNRIQLDEGHLQSASSPHQPFAETLSIPDRLSQSSRDRILQLIVRTAKSQICITSFPSADCLDLLIKMGIAKKFETDAWIHPFTFKSEECRPELLTALVAAGCVCFGVKTVSRTGLVLVEIVRVALSRVIEEDNSAVRDLQWLQASMIWLDIAAFCGFKRKMEVAESNLQPLITAMRRYGKFDRVAYSPITPSTANSASQLHETWLQWVEAQSFCRLAHHLFEHDTFMTLTKHRNPLLSYAELSLPLPASRALWLAPSADEWRTIYLGQQSSSHRQAPSLRSILADSGIMRCMTPEVDLQVTTSTYLSGIAAQVWEHGKLVSLHANGGDDSDATARLWNQSRHEKLCDILHTSELSTNVATFSAASMKHFLLMTLHVNLDNIMRFAGKCGEAEAQQAYQALVVWLPTKPARLALWHAVQVVRAARDAAPYQLRGCDAFLTWHAVSLMWAYGMLQQNVARRTARSSPVPESSTLEASAPASQKRFVLLDGERSAEVDDFLYRNDGIPCMRLLDSSHTVCSLHKAQNVMTIGIEVLERNCPGEGRVGMPQMIKSLCDLMEELGKLR
ncbi:hypothetical protein KC331_g4668 [Hortaea werneckii]|nr:hypothetical protein KC331_g4668 [Hortaea werneckii]KAI7714917.1 hypothetical protein KC353_g6488 [Hortaea werneckii]